MLVQVQRARAIPHHVRRFLEVENGVAVLWVLEGDFTRAEARVLEAQINNKITAQGQHPAAAALP